MGNLQHYDVLPDLVGGELVALNVYLRYEAYKSELTSMAKGKYLAR